LTTIGVGKISHNPEIAGSNPAPATILATLEMDILEKLK